MICAPAPSVGGFFLVVFHDLPPKDRLMFFLEACIGLIILVSEH